MEERIVVLVLYIESLVFILFSFITRRLFMRVSIDIKKQHKMKHRLRKARLRILTLHFSLEVKQRHDKT